jgi:hypothetical protein
MPGDLPEASTLRRPLVDQGATFRHRPLSARRPSPRRAPRGSCRSARRDSSCAGRRSSPQRWPGSARGGTGRRPAPPPAPRSEPPRRRRWPDPGRSPPGPGVLAARPSGVRHPGRPIPLRPCGCRSQSACPTLRPAGHPLAQRREPDRPATSSILIRASTCLANAYCRPDRSPISGSALVRPWRTPPSVRVERGPATS